jgi:hypothetical protein
VLQQGCYEAVKGAPTLPQGLQVVRSRSLLPHGTWGTKMRSWDTVPRGMVPGMPCRAGHPCGTGHQYRVRHDCGARSR